MDLLGVSWMLVLLVAVSHCYPVQQAASKIQSLGAPKGQVPYGSPMAEAVASSGSQSSASPQSSQAVVKQPAQNQEYAWAVQPQFPFYQEAPQQGQLRISPPAPPVQQSYVPQYQAGELINTEQVAEHGDFETEIEEPVYMPLAAPVNPEPQFISPPHPPPVPGLLIPYDYMFLTGQYPVGTITHSSSEFEHGRDHWQDSHYLKYDHLPEPRPLVQVPKQQVAAPQLRSFRQYPSYPLLG